MTRPRLGALRIAGAAIVFAATTLAASAQPVPPYAAGPQGPPPGPPGPPPSYAQNPEPTILGIVARIDGKYQIHVRDRKGYLDNVVLHQGTIINPTGFPLEPGERVAIVGHPAGGAFEANEIDIPAVAVARPWRYGYPGPFYGSVGFGYGRWGGWRGYGWW
jgi:hypothetical protein